MVAIFMTILMVIQSKIDKPPRSEEMNKYENHVSNERPYEWYIDASQTGKYSAVNCVPSSAVMAGRWLDEDFPYTVEEARALLEKNGEGWNKKYLSIFFSISGIESKLSIYNGPNDLIEEIDLGNILVVGIDLKEIVYKNSDASSIGRYIGPGGAHALIIKGYVYIDSKLYFEAYDPTGGYGASYSDGTHKGKNRLYPADEFDRAIKGNWGGYYVISKDAN